MTTVFRKTNAVAGQEKLTFPTTCPSCDHSPLEADSCTPNKALRNTMRVWLQKQKKKEEAKAASQAPPTPVETTPAAPEVQPVGGDAADRPVESIEETPKPEGAGGEPNAEENSGNADDRTGSATAQPNEVGSFLMRIPLPRIDEHGTHDQNRGATFVCLARMNMIDAACASDHDMRYIRYKPGLILARMRLRLKMRTLSGEAVQLHNL